MRTGIDELRAIVAAMNSCREDFLHRFTLEQIVQIHRMWIASDWTIYPDTWTAGQIDAALAGKPPRRDDNERPIEDAADAPSAS